MDISTIILTVLIIIIGLLIAPFMTIGILFITSNISPELGVLLFAVGVIRMLYKIIILYEQ